MRKNLAAWLEPQLGLVGDEQWGATGRRLTGLDVGDPLDWANRRIELADGNWAVTGIRFRGGDLSKPFVDIIATSVTPDAAGITALAEILPHYAAFAPLCLRVNAPEPRTLIPELAASGEATATVDMWIVAGQVADLTVRTSNDDEPFVALETIESDAAAQRVSAIYAELAASRPSIADWATPEDEESLAECAAEGLLFDVRVDGDSAGVVAAIRDDSFGLRGHCMQEICIDADHRGRGIGRATLRELARRLPNTGDVLWGHIHPGNTASLRNALAAGREIVTAQLWVTPDGYPGMPTGAGAA
ncbi:GNAT family N-acetyltransferase [Microbacterium sp. MPKO10]|uniref:GNAT family N-acetyltransferase n=1 Tax=Microbacterium sp. MPKO10 TaxID=2989818 RepID=UPI002235A36B|nr:GNAT family N-acetyltransferase [Microbacterium sp. MPKO10]MCW4456756.1 GNAT family N-acetyltransferase [Microbacterium sp. MPKO10]